jgi:hypothetical protein
VFRVEYEDSKRALDENGFVEASATNQEKRVDVDPSHVMRSVHKDKEH